MRVIRAALCAIVVFGCTNDTLTNVRLDEEQVVGAEEIVSLQANLSSEQNTEVIVLWGDSSTSTVTVPSNQSLEATHQYDLVGDYDVRAVVCKGAFGQCVRQHLGEVNVSCKAPDTSDLEDAREANLGAEEFGRCSAPRSSPDGRATGDTEGAPKSTCFSCASGDIQYSVHWLDLGSKKAFDFAKDSGSRDVVIQIGVDDPADCVQGGQSCAAGSSGSIGGLAGGTIRVIIGTKDPGPYKVTLTPK